MEAEEKNQKNASILFCFWNVFGERGPGTVRATGDTSTLIRHGGGKAEGKWIYIYIYIYIYMYNNWDKHMSVEADIWEDPIKWK